VCSPAAEELVSWSVPQSLPRTRMCTRLDAAVCTQLVVLGCLGRGSGKYNITQSTMKPMKSEKIFFANMFSCVKGSKISIESEILKFQIFLFNNLKRSTSELPPSSNVPKFEYKFNLKFVNTCFPFLCPCHFYDEVIHFNLHHTLHHKTTVHNNTLLVTVGTQHLNGYTKIFIFQSCRNPRRD
jgi:hypothetical protein